MATTSVPISGSAGAIQSSFLPQPAEAGHSLEERNALVLEHLSEVRNVALGIARRLPRHVQLDDLIQAGTVGLIDAVTRFDRARPLGLRQYLRIRISGAILDSLRELDWASRYLRTRQQKLESVTKDLENRLGRQPDSDEIAEEMGMDLQSFYEFAAAVEEMQRVEDDDSDSDRTASVIENIATDPNDSPDAMYGRMEIREQIRGAMGLLKAEHRRVLRLYYFEEQTMSQIASAMHVTESRISQIHARALEELHARLANGGTPIQ